MKNLGARKTIVIGLMFEMAQLAWYGFGSQSWCVGFCLNCKVTAQLNDYVFFFFLG